MLQDHLGKKVDLTRQSIISIEKGKTAPSLKTAFKIAQFFNRKVEDIFLIDKGIKSRGTKQKKTTYTVTITSDSPIEIVKVSRNSGHNKHPYKNR